MATHISLANISTSLSTTGQQLQQQQHSEAERLVFHQNGYCVIHPDIQLRKRGKVFRRWKTILRECPRCASEFLIQQVIQLSTSCASVVAGGTVVGGGNGLAPVGPHPLHAPPVSIVEQPYDVQMDRSDDRSSVASSITTTPMYQQQHPPPLLATNHSGRNNGSSLPPALLLHHRQQSGSTLTNHNHDTKSSRSSEEDAYSGMDDWPDHPFMAHHPQYSPKVFSQGHLLFENEPPMATSISSSSSSLSSLPRTMTTTLHGTHHDTTSHSNSLMKGPELEQNIVSPTTIPNHNTYASVSRRKQLHDTTTQTPRNVVQPSSSKSKLHQAQEEEATTSMTENNSSTSITTTDNNETTIVAVEKPTEWIRREISSSSSSSSTLINYDCVSNETGGFPIWPHDEDNNECDNNSALELLIQPSFDTIPELSETESIENIKVDATTNATTTKTKRQEGVSPVVLDQDQTPRKTNTTTNNNNNNNNNIGLLLQAAALSVLVRAAGHNNSSTANATQSSPARVKIDNQTPLRAKDIRMVRPVDLSHDERTTSLVPDKDNNCHAVKGNNNDDDTTNTASMEHSTPKRRGGAMTVPSIHQDPVETVGSSFQDVGTTKEQKVNGTNQEPASVLLSPKNGINDQMTTLVDREGLLRVNHNNRTINANPTVPIPCNFNVQQDSNSDNVQCELVVATLSTTTVIHKSEQRQQHEKAVISALPTRTRIHDPNAVEKVEHVDRTVIIADAVRADDDQDTLAKAQHQDLTVRIPDTNRWLPHSNLPRRSVSLSETRSSESVTDCIRRSASLRMSNEDYSPRRLLVRDPDIISSPKRQSKDPVGAVLLTADDATQNQNLIGDSIDPVVRSKGLEKDPTDQVKPIALSLPSVLNNGPNTNFQGAVEIKSETLMECHGEIWQPEALSVQNTVLSGIVDEMVESMLNMVSCSTQQPTSILCETHQSIPPAVDNPSDSSLPSILEADADATDKFVSTMKDRPDSRLSAGEPAKSLTGGPTPDPISSSIVEPHNKSSAPIESIAKLWNDLFCRDIDVCVGAQSDRTQTEYNEPRTATAPELKAVSNDSGEEYHDVLPGDSIADSHAVVVLPLVSAEDESLGRESISSLGTQLHLAEHNEGLVRKDFASIHDMNVTEKSIDLTANQRSHAVENVRPEEGLNPFRIKDDSQASESASNTTQSDLSTAETFNPNDREDQYTCDSSELGQNDDLDQEYSQLWRPTKHHKPKPRDHMDSHISSHGGSTVEVTGNDVDHAEEDAYSFKTRNHTENSKMKVDLTVVDKTEETDQLVSFGRTGDSSGQASFDTAVNDQIFGVERDLLGADPVSSQPHPSLRQLDVWVPVGTPNDTELFLPFVNHDVKKAVAELTSTEDHSLGDDRLGIPQTTEHKLLLVDSNVTSDRNETIPREDVQSGMLRLASDENDQKLFFGHVDTQSLLSSSDGQTSFETATTAQTLSDSNKCYTTERQCASGGISIDTAGQMSLYDSTFDQSNKIGMLPTSNTESLDESVERQYNVVNIEDSKDVWPQELSKLEVAASTIYNVKSIIASETPTLLGISNATGSEAVNPAVAERRTELGILTADDSCYEACLDDESSSNKLPRSVCDMEEDQLVFNSNEQTQNVSKVRGEIFREPGYDVICNEVEPIVTTPTVSYHGSDSEDSMMTEKEVHGVVESLSDELSLNVANGTRPERLFNHSTGVNESINTSVSVSMAETDQSKHMSSRSLAECISIETSQSLKAQIQRNVDLCRMINSTGKTIRTGHNDASFGTYSFEDAPPPSPIQSLKDIPSYETLDQSKTIHFSQHFSSEFSAFENERVTKRGSADNLVRLSEESSTDDSLVNSVLGRESERVVDFESVVDSVLGGESELLDDFDNSFEINEPHSIVFIPPLDSPEENSKLETRQFRNGYSENENPSAASDVVHRIKQHVTVLGLVGNNNHRNKIIFVDEGGMDSIFLVMNWHKVESTLQELGCAISLSLMSNNDEIVETFVESGGIQTVVRTMKRFPIHAGIQEHGCGTIWNLLASKQLDTKSEFAKVGGVACLIAALRNMLNYAGVIEQACGATWNLISGESAVPKNTFFEGGGMQCLIAAMVAHPNHEQIQEYACGAALRLMACSEESVNVFAEHGGIDSVLLAIETFNDKPAVLLQAYGAAWHFMRDNGTRTAVLADDTIDSEGVECVIEVMKENNFCSGIDEAAVRKGRITVSVSNDRRDMFASAGGLMWLMDTMEHYTLKNAALLEQCLRTAIHLISESSAFKNAFAIAGGVQYVVDGMQHHSKDKAIQQLGCEVLLSLSVVDNIFSGLDACDVLSVLHAARGSFSS